MTTSADLSVTKAHAGQLVAGGTGTWTIDVANHGPSVAQGPITVTDTLPAGTSFVSATGTGWTCTGSGQRGDLHPGRRPARRPGPADRRAADIAAPVTGADRQHRDRHRPDTGPGPGQQHRHRHRDRGHAGRPGDPEVAHGHVHGRLHRHLPVQRRQRRAVRCGRTGADHRHAAERADLHRLHRRHGHLVLRGQRARSSPAPSLARWPWATRPPSTSPFRSTRGRRRRRSSTPAHVSSPTTDPIPANNTDDDNTDVDQISDLSVTKSHTGTAVAGTNFPLVVGRPQPRTVEQPGTDHRHRRPAPAARSTSRPPAPTGTARPSAGPSRARTA